MKYNEMSIIEVVKYVNNELIKKRTMKEIEEVDFGENKGVIQKRLKRKGYIRVNNQFIQENNNTTDDTTSIIQQENNNTTDDTTSIIQQENSNTTDDTTSIIQEKFINDKKEKTLSSIEIDKLNRLLDLDIDILDRIIKEYPKRNIINNTIEVNDTSTKVTSIRVNQELYNKIKEYSKENNINIGDIFNKMMIDFLKSI